MTEREVAERVRTLFALADRFRMPSHRRTVEACMEQQDELRSGLRRLFQDLTGEPLLREPGAGHRFQSLGHVGLVVPAAIARDRARRQPARA